MKAVNLSGKHKNILCDFSIQINRNIFSVFRILIVKKKLTTSYKFINISKEIFSRVTKTTKRIKKRKRVKV